MHGITEVNIIIFFFISALSLLEELISPIITPLVLLFMIRPRAQTIVDFFRNFTVDVTGVGDICSFAQMDVRKHGNSAWQQASPEDELEPQPSTLKAMTNAYTRAEAGKTEMSLINFTLANPDWKPPQESKEFINALRGHATRDVETLSVLDEEKLQSNPLYSSLTALENVGGVYTEIAQGLLKSSTLHSELQNSEKSPYLCREKSIFDSFNCTKRNFLLFQKWEEIHFCTKKKGSEHKNAFYLDLKKS